MLSRAIRVIALLVVISMAGAVVFAADPWNTGSIWGRTPASPGAQNSPASVLSPMGSVGIVSSPQPVARVTAGFIPPDNGIPAPRPSVASVSAVGVAIKGNPSAGAHLATMKCAGCHGQDGSGQGLDLDQLGGQKPIPWTDKAQMSQMSDQEIASKITSPNAQLDPDAKMPSFSNLSGQDLDDLVAYIRSLGQ